MLGFSIGVSALQASQRAMEIVGNNVSNANTPGYHRQVVQLATMQPMQIRGLSIGRGVEVSGIQRMISDQVEQALIRKSAEAGFSDAQLSQMSHLESRLSTETGSPDVRLETLFNQMVQLSSRVSDSSSRKLVIGSAQQLANEFNSLAADLFQQGADLDKSIAQTVGEINPLAQQVAQLNGEISRLNNQDIEANDLLDQRMQLIHELSQRIGIEVQAGNQGQVTLLADGVPLVIGERAIELVATHDDSGAASVRVAGSDAGFPITGGTLGGLLNARNERLPEYRARLDDLAREVARAFNAVQSTGVGVAGAFSSLTGQQSVNDVNAKLSSAGLPFPPTAGSLFVAVTDTATGQRTLTEIAIDPAQQSLNDVASALAAVPNLQAFVNTQTGKLSLFAAPGHTLDFRGGLDTPPTTTFSAGTTTTPSLGGVFNGDSNDRHSFTFSSNGTVGVTPGLQLRVTDQAGNTITTLDVGQGYEAGTPLRIGNGLTVSLSAGTVASGDSFSSQVVGAPDTAGMLSALGLNTFFTGQDATTLKVSAELIANADRLATSRSGQPGDTTNLQRLIGLRDTPTMTGDSETFSDFFHQILSDIGTDVRSLTEAHETNQLLTDRLNATRQSVSGVDINEEMVNLLKFQRMFQVASRYINAVNEALDSLLAIR